MIHCVRTVEPDWPPDPGQTRTQIGVWWVEWSGTEPTEAEVAAMMTPSPAQVTAGQRTEAKRELADRLPRGKALRSLAAVANDANNDLRRWLMGLKQAITLATNIADLKVRVAALPNLPDRTLSQVRAALENKLDSGDADG